MNMFLFDKFLTSYPDNFGKKLAFIEKTFFRSEDVVSASLQSPQKKTNIKRNENNQTNRL